MSKNVSFVIENVKNFIHDIEVFIKKYQENWVKKSFYVVSVITTTEPLILGPP